MLGLELVVALGVSVLVCSVIAGRLRIAPPVLLLACGALLGFVPALRGDHAAAGSDAAAVPAIRRAEAEYTALRLELLAHKRVTVVRLRDERRIDDTVLRQIQSKLDFEEIRLARREVTD